MIDLDLVGALDAQRCQRTPVILDGSLTDDRPPVLCGQCKLDVPRGGGVQMRADLWICSACWKIRVLGQNRRAAIERKREKAA